jgi:hypothetical protein
VELGTGVSTEAFLLVVNRGGFDDGFHCRRFTAQVGWNAVMPDGRPSENPYSIARFEDWLFTESGEDIRGFLDGGVVLK